MLGQKREGRVDGRGVGLRVVILITGQSVAHVVRCVWKLFIKASRMLQQTENCHTQRPHNAHSKINSSDSWPWYKIQRIWGQLGENSCHLTNQCPHCLHSKCTCACLSARGCVGLKNEAWSSILVHWNSWDNWTGTPHIILT